MAEMFYLKPCLPCMYTRFRRLYLQINETNLKDPNLHIYKKSQNSYKISLSLIS